jgi:hypothetical protein
MVIVSQTKLREFEVATPNNPIPGYLHKHVLGNDADRRASI